MASDVTPAAHADAWNRLYPVGTPVRYRPILGEDAYELAETRTPAWLVGHGRAVVSITGRSGGVFLDHIEVLCSEAVLREQIATEILAVYPDSDPVINAATDAWDACWSQPGHGIARGRCCVASMAAAVRDTTARIAQGGDR